MAIRLSRNGEVLEQGWSRINLPSDIAKAFRTLCKETSQDQGALLLLMMKRYVKTERLNMKLVDQ